MRQGIEREYRKAAPRASGRSWDGSFRRRFGRLPPVAAERLGRASAVDLKTWADKILDAETLDDVFGRRS